MSLKAKFGWNDSRLVVPIRHLKQEKVAKLLNDVYERFRREFGLSPDNRFITIRTTDGYSLNLNDTVEDVVSDGDCFVLVDYSSWMKEHTRCIINQLFIELLYFPIFLGGFEIS
jgi:hypothetical protein